MTFVGLDLHKHHITACALDAAGTVLAESRRLPPQWEAVEAWLAALPTPLTVAMECTLYWAWLVERLERAGHHAVVAHAYQVKLIWQARSKTDPIDARKLAELLRVNLLPTIWVADATTRARRQVLRGRAFLVRQRTQVKNRIHGHLMAENLLSPMTDVYGQAGRAWLATVPLSPVLRAQVDQLLRLHDYLTGEIQQLDTAIKRMATGDVQVQRLTSIPGVGRFSALFLLAEIGPITPVSARATSSRPTRGSCPRRGARAARRRTAASGARATAG